MNNSRRTAAYIITRWMLTKDFPADLLPNGPDRAFVQDLVYTVIRRLRPLRRILGGFVKTWPKGELEALLYVGAAQILYMDDVPDFAAVNETVNAAKACENPSVARVTNGVLRNLIRQRDSIGLGTELETFPTALGKRWTARFGAENAERLAAWHNAPAETFLARKDGSFVALERGTKVTDIAGYAEGEFIVQDPGTALSVSLLNPQPGESVLDACAAPGGKTVQMAWRGAKVTACEINPKRRRRLEENLQRLNLAVEVLSELPSAANAQTSKRFSKILVDAPCSNSGVLRRRPDARWNWSVEKLKALVKMQAEILDVVAPLVVSGGTLVYSTCSNEPEENQQQVDAFLARHPEFKLADTKESVPYESGMDGAFAAALIRSSTSFVVRKAAFAPARAAN